MIVKQNYALCFRGAGAEIWGSNALLRKCQMKIHKAFGRLSGTTTLADLAKVDRYSMRVSGTVVKIKYWNSFVEMDSKHLVKQVFLASIALTQQLARNRPRSIVKLWAGRVSSLLSSLSLPNDPNDPQTVKIAAVVKQFQRQYVDEYVDLII